ncbi:multicopper oxidase domain-containing protein [Phycicoccus duodecadis]|uniref:Multicopper oxidase n=1 Tax=Phycicoccus duodecadis TaxID=173053 RepID=A0A2N3YF51_9MICO|nr:multicopper oxidase domain-containing protein [Phycicoccus duodecadis]PKW25475.1 multicopper oxidase [Phycicoccus duodecadis]
MTSRLRATGTRSLALLAALVVACGLAPLAPAAAAPAPAAPAHLPRLVTSRPTLAAAGNGHLAPQGCQTSGTTATCVLYARPGTVQLLGRSIPIWGWSSAASGNPTLPGPLLVVDQGSTVTVKVHNELPGALSLAVPGVPAASLGAGFGAASTTGVAPQGDGSFTFTASRPGTFVYEAGHTADSARQIAMGVAGVLVVRPSDGTSAYGDTASAYTDEAVVALTEIDPALNADPARFDMRDFSPRYRLINGKSFPETDVIPSDQGHRLLLRYADLGGLPHPMSILGADQVAVARDGHPLTYPQGEVVEPLVPGQTADTIVTVPSGADSELALIESGTHLDNDSMTTADPTQTATGGMLTFIDTNAPKPSADRIGPAVSNVTATPNPSDATQDMTVTADFSEAATGGSTVTRAEVVIDDVRTVGPGAGIAFTGSFGTTTVSGATATIPAAVLAAPGFAAGRHVVYVRALDGAGNWGAVGSVAVNVPKLGPQTTGAVITPDPANGSSVLKLTATGNDSSFGGHITGAEYFLDLATDATGNVTTVPAGGTGTAMSYVKDRTITSETASIPVTSALGEGTHHVWVHSLDSQNLWGPLRDVPFTVDLVGPVTIASAMSPSALNGAVSDPSNPGFATVTARVQDEQNGSSVTSTVVQAVAFFDDAAAPSATHKGLTLQATDGAFDTSVEDVYGLVPLSQVKSWSQGEHQVYVYGQDAAGNWGTTTVATFVVDTVRPVIATLTAAATSGATPATVTVTANLSGTQTSDITYGEVWYGTVDPGVGRANKVTVSYTGTQAAFTIPLAQLPLGVTTINVRLQDKAGNWSAAARTTYTVSATTSALTFDSTSFPGTGWSAAGAAKRSTTAPLMVGSGYLQATGGKAPATVTNTTLTPYANAQFLVRGSTLAVKAGQAVTVYRGGSSSQPTTFAVVASGSGAALALTPVLAGQTTATGTPIVIGNTVIATVRLMMDTTAGQLTFAVYNAAGSLLGVQQLSNGSAAAPISKVWLGLVDQSTGLKPSGYVSLDQLQRW